MRKLWHEGSYLVHIRAQIDNAKISSTLSQQPMPLQGTWRSRRQCLSCSHFKEVVEEQKFEDFDSSSARRKLGKFVAAHFSKSVLSYFVSLIMIKLR